jgi:hypothetical protein
MIELGVETRRKKVAVETDEPARYLVLGDFGARADSGPILVDRDNLDSVLERFAGAGGFSSGPAVPAPGGFCRFA